jgi:sugar/nucleoside kinase (ribokinase family)/thymidylate kinase
MSTVIGLGLAVFDVLFTIEQLPEWDHVQLASDLVLEGGGSTANVVSALARLGHSAHWIGAVGADAFGNRLLDGLRAGGVHIERARVLDSAATPASVVFTDGSGRRRAITYALDPALAVTLEAADLDLISRSDALHVNGRFARAAIPAVQAARQAGALVSVNIGADPSAAEWSPFLQAADLAITACRDREAAQKAARELLEHGARIAVATAGHLGSVCATHRDVMFHQRAFAVNSRDPTGAGDAYQAAFLHGLLAGRSIHECAELGSAAGALTCTAIGSRRALPDRDQLESFVAANRRPSAQGEPESPRERSSFSVAHYPGRVIPARTARPPRPPAWDVFSRPIGLRPHGRRGKLVSISGIDGSGKTTTLRTMRRYLESRGQPCRIFKLPSREIKASSWFLAYNQDPFRARERGVDYAALCTMLLGDRLNTIRTQVIPHLERGVFVLVDRYLFTPLAELLLFDDDLSTVEAIKGLAQQFPAPDLAILTDTPLEIARRRIHARPEERTLALDTDLFERRIAAFETIGAANGAVTVPTQDLASTVAVLRPHLNRLLLESSATAAEPAKVAQRA